MHKWFRLANSWRRVYQGLDCRRQRSSKQTRLPIAGKRLEQKLEFRCKRRRKKAICFIQHLIHAQRQPRNI